MAIDWKILSTDDIGRTMVVEYTGDATLTVNVPLPHFETDLETWVQKFAPTIQETVTPPLQVSVGATGSFTPVVAVPAPAVAVPQPPNITGSISDEYIRALIYSVLDEIAKSKV